MLRSSGETLLHMLAREGLEEAGLFLTTQDIKSNIVNADGETALHVSCTVGLPSLTTALLQVKGYCCTLFVLVYSILLFIVPRVFTVFSIYSKPHMLD